MNISYVGSLSDSSVAKGNSDSTADTQVTIYVGTKKWNVIQ